MNERSMPKIIYIRKQKIRKNKNELFINKIRPVINIWTYFMLPFCDPTGPYYEVMQQKTRSAIYAGHTGF
jgi:hypothetical protein